MNFVSALFRMAFGLMFVAASVSKILYPAEFALVVVNYQILPDMLVNPLALALPWVELVCGLALLTNCFARGAAAILNLLLLVFLGVLWFNVSRGLDVACGCFTVRPEAQGDMIQSAVRDTALLAVGLVVLWRSFAEAPAGRRGPAPVAGEPEPAPAADDAPASAGDEWGAFAGRPAEAANGPEEVEEPGEPIPMGPAPEDDAPGEAEAEQSAEPEPAADSADEIVFEAAAEPPAEEVPEAEVAGEPVEAPGEPVAETEPGMKVAPEEPAAQDAEFVFSEAGEADEEPAGAADAPAGASETKGDFVFEDEAEARDGAAKG
ncbi:MauE/DoxX family redox-associated membrane protein [Desulfocurvus sp. DL9XJH121]